MALVGLLEDNELNKYNGNWHVKNMFFHNIACLHAWLLQNIGKQLLAHFFGENINFTSKNKILHGLNWSKAHMNSWFMIQCRIFLATFPLTLEWMHCSNLCMEKNKIIIMLWMTKCHSPTCTLSYTAQFPNSHWGSQWNP